MTRNEQLALAGFLAFSCAPIWRSGLNEGLTLWGWVFNHSIWGPPAEYVPESMFIPEKES